MEFDDNSAVFELELETRNFDKNLKKSQRSFTVFADHAVDKITTVRQQFTNYLVNDLAGNAIKNAFESSFEFLSNFADKSKELVKVADNFNAPIEAVSKYQAVAEKAGVELSELVDVAGALDFTDAAASAGALGIELDALQQGDEADKFAVVVDALSGVPDEADRAALALKLFGERADDLAPIMKNAGGSIRSTIDAAKEAGLISTAQQAQDAAQFAESLEKLKNCATGLANVCASALLPVFQEGAEMITEIVQGLAGLTGGSNGASAELVRLADSATKAREETEKLTKLDAEQFSFVSDLAGQGTLTEETFNKAVGVVEELQERYGDLGFSVDKSRRSIEAATDAQERFNKAAKEQQRAALQKEIEAGEKKERDLSSQAQQELERQSGFWAGVMHEPRMLIDKATGNEDSWSKKINGINDQIFDERKRLYELRKKMKELEEPEAAGTEESATPSPEESATPTLEESATLKPHIGRYADRVGLNNPKPGEESETTPPKIEAPSAAEENAPSPVVSGRSSTVSAPFGRDNPHIFRYAASGVAGAVSDDAGAASAGAAPWSAATLRLDDEIARFERTQERAGRTSEENEIADVHAEEADYRAKVDARIVEERSKGKSGQNAELIATLEKKLEESTQREAERVDAIKAELDAQIEESTAEFAPKEKPEKGEGDAAPEPVDPYEQEKDEALDKIETEAESIHNALQERLKLADTDEERERIAAQMEELDETTQEKKDAALAEIDDKRFQDALEEFQNWFGKTSPTDFGEEQEEAYRGTEETVKGTSATFSAFEAANEAQSTDAEKALKESQRQTRLLDEIRWALKNQTPTFA